jgi:hypothetical protein
MKGSGLHAAVSTALLVGCACVGYAADVDNVPTKAPPLPSGPMTRKGVQDFFLTDCQLTWYGVRIFGTVDVGGGYQTHGAPFDPFFITGASYFI